MEEEKHNEEGKGVVKIVARMREQGRKVAARETRGITRRKTSRNKVTDPGEEKQRYDAVCLKERGGVEAG